MGHRTAQDVRSRSESARKVEKFEVREKTEKKDTSEKERERERKRKRDKFGTRNEQS